MLVLVQSYRAENFGELITADHKVLREGSEARSNHRYAVVAQDMATQWSQSYPCKTKTSQETLHNLMKFLETTRKPKVIYTDNSLEFGKSCEESSWNHCTSTPQRSKIWGSVLGRNRVARARCPRSSVEAGQKCVQIEGARKNNFLLTFRK